MNNPARLAADLATVIGIGTADGWGYEADRLIALGWTRGVPYEYGAGVLRQPVDPPIDEEWLCPHGSPTLTCERCEMGLDEERLARALIPVLQPVMDDLGIPNYRGEWSDAVAAAIAKAYREDIEGEDKITTAQLDWMDQHGRK